MTHRPLAPNPVLVTHRLVRLAARLRASPRVLAQTFLALFTERELPTTLTNMVLVLALTTMLTGFEVALWLALIATPLVIAILGGAAVVFGRNLE